MIRTGLIGLGKMGISHCAILGAHPEVELVVCDSSKFHLMALEKYSPFTCYSDYKKMLDEAKLDALFIATPTRLHADMALTAMDRGLHLFIEKPLCLNMEEARAITAKAREKGLVTQVGYHNRFIGTFREMKRLLDAGVIGPVYHFLGEAYGPVVLREKGDTWRSSKNEGGGCLYDYATHVINLLNYCFGMPRAVGGTVMQSVFSRDVDDAVYATIQYDKGLSGQLSVNWSEESFRKMSTQITLVGKGGRMVCDAQELKVYLTADNPAEGLRKGWNLKWLTDLSPEIGFYLRGEEYSAQVEHFIRCVKEGRPDPLHDVAAAAETCAVTEMLQNDARK